MNALTRAARERGLATMESQVLSSNADMLRFAHGLGFELQHLPDDIRIVRIVKGLQPAAPQAHPPMSGFDSVLHKDLSRAD